MDLHSHFKAFSDSVSPLNDEAVEALVRLAFYCGAQAAQSVLVEECDKPNLSSTDASRAMLKLQRQTQEGMR